jgi:hypothetical protein
MEKQTEQFTFTVPAGHEEAGKEITKDFTFDVVADDNEAQTILSEKKWSLTELVNKALKANARSSAYQSATLPYRPDTSKRSPDDIRESMVRDAIRLGLTEEQARNYVDSLPNVRG